MHSLASPIGAAVLVFVLCPSAGAADKPKIVQRIGPIAIDGSHDASSLRRLLGDGCYVADEGHLGGRYYTNTKRSLTFHAEFGVDWALESIDIQRGLHVPDACQQSATLVTKLLDGPLLIQHGIRLGMNARALIKVLGTPSSDKTSKGLRVLTFQTTYESDDRVGLFYDAYYAPQDGRLVLIALHDGE